MSSSIDNSILKQKAAKAHQTKCSKTLVGDGLGKSERHLGINETKHFGVKNEVIDERSRCHYNLSLASNDCLVETTASTKKEILNNSSKPPFK